MSASDELQIKLTARGDLRDKLADARSELKKLEKQFREASDEIAKTGKTSRDIDKLGRSVMDARRKVVELGKQAKEADRHLDTMATSGTRDLKKLAGQADKTRGSLRSMATSMAGIGGKGGGGSLATAAGVVTAGLAAVGFAAYSAGKNFVSAAMDAEETRARFEAVFGPQAPSMSNWIEQQVESFSANRHELRDVTSRFAGLAKMAGLSGEAMNTFSSDLAMAGMDLASHFNTSNADAFAKIMSGLAGESEPLRDFNIFINEDLVQAAGVFNGVIGSMDDDLTEQQKVMLRSKLILASLGDANGDLAKTIDSPANKMKRLRNELSMAAVDIGYALMPAVAGLADNIRNELPTIVPAITNVADAFATRVMPAVIDLLPELTTMVVKGAELGERIMPVLSGAIDLTALAFEGFAIMADAVATAVNAVASAFQWVGEQIERLPSPPGWLTGGLGSIGGGLADAAGWLVPGDSASPWGGAGSMTANLAAHAGISSGIPGVRVTSSVRGFALGSPWSDHLTGAAADYQGSNLPSLANAYRRAGGHAEFHGSGAGRHLHAVAPAAPKGMGDAAMPAMRRTVSAPAATAVTFGAGSIVVTGTPGMSEASIARLVRREVARVLDGSYR